MKIEIYGDSIEARVNVDPVSLLWEWRVYVGGRLAEVAKGTSNFREVAEREAREHLLRETKDRAAAWQLAVAAMENES